MTNAEFITLHDRLSDILSPGRLEIRLTDRSVVLRCYDGVLYIANEVGYRECESRRDGISNLLAERATAMRKTLDAKKQN